jgi:RecB family exonuclease
MRFSASRMKLWQSCALAAHYRYDQKLPTRQSGRATFGTVCHKALEHLNKTGDYEASVALFKDLWEHPEKIGAEPDYWPKGSSWAPLKERGLEMLKHVHDLHRFQTHTVLAVEHKFLVRLGRHELFGFVDLVDMERSGTGTELCRVVDYKTSSRIPSQAELGLDLQICTYMYAVNQKEFWTGIPGDPEFPGMENGEWLWETVGKMAEKRAIWYALWSHKQIDAGPRTDLDFRRMYRLCEEIARAEELGVHVPHIGEACQWCDYQEPCSLEIPVAVSQVSDPNDRTRWI